MRMSDLKILNFLLQQSDHVFKFEKLFKKATKKMENATKKVDIDPGMFKYINEQFIPLLPNKNAKVQLNVDEKERDKRKKKQKEEMEREKEKQKQKQLGGKT